MNKIIYTISTMVLFTLLSSPAFAVITNEQANVPEFSMIAASVAFAGASVGYLFLRRKN